jgi:hypothetical protein
LGAAASANLGYAARVSRSALMFLLLACLGLAACGEASDGGVAGGWCGTDVRLAADCQGENYAEFEQEGSAIAGQFCKAYGQNCLPLTKGTLKGDSLRFEYTSEKDPMVGQFSLSGDTLTGYVFSTECGCGPPAVTLYHVAGAD